MYGTIVLYEAIWIQTLAYISSVDRAYVTKHLEAKPL